MSYQNLVLAESKENRRQWPGTNSSRPRRQEPRAPGQYAQVLAKMCADPTARAASMSAHRGFAHWTAGTPDPAVSNLVTREAVGSSWTRLLCSRTLFCPRNATKGWAS